MKARNFRSGRSRQVSITLDAATFANEIAGALATEFDGIPHKVKEVARLTGCNERTVKNWFQARNGPNGECLVALIRHSDQVLRLVLRLAQRNDLLQAADVAEARARLKEAVSRIDGLLDGQSQSSHPPSAPLDTDA